MSEKAHPQFGPVTPAVPFPYSEVIMLCEAVSQLATHACTRWSGAVVAGATDFQLVTAMQDLADSIRRTAGSFSNNLEWGSAKTQSCEIPLALPLFIMFGALGAVLRITTKDALSRNIPSMEESKRNNKELADAMTILVRLSSELNAFFTAQREGKSG